MKTLFLLVLLESFLTVIRAQSLSASPDSLPSANEARNIYGFSVCSAFCTVTSLMGMPKISDMIMTNLIAVYTDQTEASQPTTRSIYSDFMNQLNENKMSCERVLQCFSHSASDKVDPQEKLYLAHNETESVPFIEPLFEMNEYLAPKSEQQTIDNDSNRSKDVERILEAEKRRVLHRIRGLPFSRVEPESRNGEKLSKEAESLAVQLVFILIGIGLVIVGPPM
ncbi:hypothetical protein BDR26DRAFT_857727 [Obelidium mucronatum]|nr:hypothetical protein BDR26DRAFT_857727 [Obelidium mucronatum]